MGGISLQKHFVLKWDVHTQRNATPLLDGWVQSPIWNFCTPRYAILVTVKQHEHIWGGGSKSFLGTSMWVRML